MPDYEPVEMWKMPEFHGPLHELTTKLSELRVECGQKGYRNLRIDCVSGIVVVADKVKGK